MQMYKILALNCLISAYSLSVLYYDGIKLGDTYLEPFLLPRISAHSSTALTLHIWFPPHHSQMTSVGVLVAMCFLFITRSKVSTRQHHTARMHADQHNSFA
jgi:hypothetical protein